MSLLIRIHLDVTITSTRPRPRLARISLFAEYLKHCNQASIMAIPDVVETLVVTRNNRIVVWKTAADVKAVFIDLTFAQVPATLVNAPSNMPHGCQKDHYLNFGSWRHVLTSQSLSRHSN